MPDTLHTPISPLDAAPALAGEHSRVPDSSGAAECSILTPAVLAALLLDRMPPAGLSEAAKLLALEAYSSRPDRQGAVQAARLNERNKSASSVRQAANAVLRRAQEECAAPVPASSPRAAERPALHATGWRSGGNRPGTVFAPSVDEAALQARSEAAAALKSAQSSTLYRLHQAERDERNLAPRLKANGPAKCFTGWGEYQIAKDNAELVAEHTCTKAPSAIATLSKAQLLTKAGKESDPAVSCTKGRLSAGISAKERKRIRSKR